MKLLKEKGITLVALVVTIIILLILAGVTIAQISGEDGLFSRVRQAVEKYKDASTEEQQQILEIDKFVSEFSTTEQEGVTVKITKLEVTAGTDSIDVLVEVEGEPSKIEYSIDNGKTYQTKEGDITSRTYKYENLKPGGYFIKIRVYDAEEKYQEGTSDIVTVTPITTAEEGDVLKDKTFLTGEGIIKTGIIETKDTINTTLDAGTRIPIPSGYYSGEGKVAAKSLADQTPGTATSDQIVSGYSAWVNGDQVDGNIPNQGGTNIEVTEEKTPIPMGYYDGTGQVIANVGAKPKPGVTENKAVGYKNCILIKDKENSDSVNISEYLPVEICKTLSSGNFALTSVSSRFDKSLSGMPLDGRSFGTGSMSYNASNYILSLNRTFGDGRFCGNYQLFLRKYISFLQLSSGMIYESYFNVMVYKKRVSNCCI